MTLRALKNQPDFSMIPQAGDLQDPLTGVSDTVVTCYDVLDVALAGGVYDFTGGKYEGNPNLPYDVAQTRQAEWLLDQIGCRAGMHFLDLGCGNGRLLEAAEARGARATGITISERQIGRNRRKGLNVELMNYRDMPPSWNGRFDGIIANGSVEHFVQVEDALRGHQNDIYCEMFDICYRLLKPGGRLATTIIHFRRPIDPAQVNRGSAAHPLGSDHFHFAKVLLEDFGGWYPLPGQLQECAEKLFILQHWEDGTQDYHWTSEAWLKILKRQVTRNPRVWFALLRTWLRKPTSTRRILRNFVKAQSWNWQFRPIDDSSAPTQLRRDVWQRVD